VEEKIPMRFLFKTLILLCFMSVFSSFSRQPDYRIAFIGDSLTQMARWTELLDRKDIYVYAQNGDITGNMKKNVDFIIQVEPEICFIMGGINDIAQGVAINDIFSNIRHMAMKMKAWGIKPVIQSVLYIEAEEGGFTQWNTKVEPLNKMLFEFCQKNDIEYLDLNSHLTENNSLKPEYTYDGIHLNNFGYFIWKSEVQKILTKHAI
jgi:lysophospholipase L1-like esterase